MKKIFRNLHNIFRTRVVFVDKERVMRHGHLIQYIIRETDGKKILKEPILLAIIEAVGVAKVEGENKPTKIIEHITIPASGVQIVN